MKMTDHQKRLWRSMIEEIQNFLDGKSNNFFNLVGNLEGALDASEISDENIVKQWYQYWTPLEIMRAIQGNNIDRIKAQQELINMRNFLLNFT
jgi:L-rhamnose mutarotase